MKEYNDYTDSPLYLAWERTHEILSLIEWEQGVSSFWPMFDQVVAESLGLDK